MRELNTLPRAGNSRFGQAHAGWRQVWVGLLAVVLAAQLRAEVTFTSPGLAFTRMDEQGRLAETAGHETPVQLSLTLPESVQVGLKTVTLGGRAVLGLPVGTKGSQVMREWGWVDDAVALPGWARPAVVCDPAFQNIRAGLGGVPKELTFLVACTGSSVPPPDQTTWTPEKLRQSAAAVWRDWR